MNRTTLKYALKALRNRERDATTQAKDLEALAPFSADPDVKKSRLSQARALRKEARHLNRAIIDLEARTSLILEEVEA